MSARRRNFHSLRRCARFESRDRLASVDLADWSLHLDLRNHDDSALDSSTPSATTNNGSGVDGPTNPLTDRADDVQRSGRYIMDIHRRARRVL